MLKDCFGELLWEWKDGVLQWPPAALCSFEVLAVVCKKKYRSDFSPVPLASLVCWKGQKRD